MWTLSHLRVYDEVARLVAGGSMKDLAWRGPNLELVARMLVTDCQGHLPGVVGTVAVSKSVNA